MQKRKPKQSRAKGAAKRPDYKLGARIREARQAAQMKLRELAKRTGLSESLISRIENDKAMPSIGSLHDISVALGINISWFFDTGHNGRSTIVLRRGERLVIDYRADGSTIENFVPFGGKHLLQGFLLIVAPGGKNETNRKHSGEEVGYMLDGELELTVGGQIYRLKAGDSFNFRSEDPHSYRNPGKKKAVLVWMNAPPTM